jgi:hypothetical protein
MLGRLKSGVFIASMAEADWFMVLIRDSAAHIQTYVAEPPGDPVALVQRLMLEPSAAQAVSGQEPDLGEQVRLTWTWLVAIAAARLLLHLHPDSEGLYLTPSGLPAHPCHIKSAKDGLIWAETFAAADPRDSRIMDMNVARIAGRLECHRYGFFMSPLFSGIERRPAFEQSGVQVWSVEV